MKKIIFLIVSFAFTTGCVAPGLYHWGDYEQSLYDYTKRPGEVEAYIADLDAIILKGEEAGNVPPGMYAEYGFALTKVGRDEEAQAYFSKEREKWPESETLMTLVLDGSEESSDETDDATVENVNSATESDEGEG